MTTNILLAALSQDLYRVALGFHNGSEKMAERFVQESLKRRKEINSEQFKPFVKKLLKNLPDTLSQNNKQKLAEDALMLSVLFQQYAVKMSGDSKK